MAILMAGTLAAGCGGASKDTMSAASVTEETSADYGAYKNEPGTAWRKTAQSPPNRHRDTGEHQPEADKTVTLNMETREFETVLSGIPGQSYRDRRIHGNI